jgi:aspartate/methionine/tyrosine aminotransferase
MSFDKTEYLQWYIPRMSSGKNPINLHASGVARLDASEIDPATGKHATMVSRFEEGLSAWLGIKTDEVCFTPGATGGTLLALLTFARRGSELIVESPIYEPMLRQAERLNPVRRFSRRREHGWKIPLDEIAEMLTDTTSVVMITEPSNPSGTFCDRSAILSLAEMAARCGAVLLINEVYRCFSERPSFHGEAENIVVVSSFSKFFGTYGLRLGWLSGTSTLIQRARRAHMNMGMATQTAAAYGVSVLGKAEKLRAKALHVSAAGVDTVEKWVGSTPGIDWTKPMGPGFACVSLPGALRDDIGFAETLLNDFGVFVIPGTYFEVPGSIRLSWLQSGDKLGEGLGLIAKALGS